MKFTGGPVCVLKICWCVFFVFKRFRCGLNFEARVKIGDRFLACQTRTKCRAKHCRMKGTYSTRRANRPKSLEKQQTQICEDARQSI